MRKQPSVESVVFVIDDDASVRSSLKSLFKSVDLYVELYGSADEFLNSQRPDAASCLVGNKERSTPHLPGVHHSLVI